MQLVSNEWLLHYAILPSFVSVSYPKGLGNIFNWQMEAGVEKG
jgi:hypothetical protein